jgi:four helix bundle protein
MEPKIKIRNFKDLRAWQEAHELVLLVYKLTKTFPKSETFILVSQILRAVISVSSNIAEGFSRQGLKEKIQFYFMASASLTEVENQILISKDVGYLSEEQFIGVSNQILLVQKLISGLIKSLRRHQVVRD